MVLELKLSVSTSSKSLFLIFVELAYLYLRKKIIKIDGSMAIAWSSTLKFTVEKTTSTLVGSLASGEGFVNVYSGTGRVLMAPVRENKGINAPKE